MAVSGSDGCWVPRKMKKASTQFITDERVKEGTTVNTIVWHTIYIKSYPGIENRRLHSCFPNSN